MSTTVQEMSEGELLQIEKARKLDITEQVYFDIIRQKTATLIASCCASGASSAEQSKEIVEKMRLFGEKAGIAFQIKDDILDVIGDEKIIGKPLNSDMGLNKASYPSVIGLEASKERAENLCFEALEILSALPYETDELERLSKFIILRDK